VVDEETINCKETIRKYKPKMTKMEFEVITKMKKTEGTNQLKVINDFKDRVIKFGNKKALMQDRINELYGNEDNNNGNKINDDSSADLEKEFEKNKFMHQFEFKEPILKRKRVDLETKKNIIKTKLDSKKNLLTETTKSMDKASTDFHKSLNISKDNLELEMNFEDPRDKKKAPKIEYDVKKKKFVQKENKLWFKNEAGVKVKDTDKFGR